MESGFLGKTIEKDGLHKRAAAGDARSQSACDITLALRNGKAQLCVRES